MAAMNRAKEDMSTITLSDPELPHPILYNFMYIQWEANEVRDCIFVTRNYLNFYVSRRKYIFFIYYFYITV
jgi:hypothetical protein